MSVRPVDLLTMLPRLTEASRIQHATDRQPGVAQQSLSVTGQQQAERARQQVTQKSATERADVHRDGGGQNPQDRQEPKQRQTKAKESKSTQSPDGIGGRLDLKI